MNKTIDKKMKDINAKLRKINSKMISILSRNHLYKIAKKLRNENKKLKKVDKKNVEQNRLKRQILTSRTAIWSSKEVYVEKYIETYNRQPTNKEISRRRFM